MTEALTAKIQEKELALLAEIDRVFKEHGLEYFLAYGTTLGCVRHGGFIPWDDDVDLFIRGEDYPKLKEMFASGDIGFLSLHDFETQKGYPYIFPKIVDNRTQLKEERYKHLPYTGGVYVDIFPLFALSDNGIKRYFSEKRRYLRYARVRGYYLNNTVGNPIKRLGLKLIRLFTNPDKIQRKLYKRYIKGTKGGKMLIEPNTFAKKGRIEKRFFDEKAEMQFEGLSLPVPKDYDGYLTATYGDYMQLPPKECRVSAHSFARLDLGED